MKIQITFDEVDERSVVNRLFRDYTEEGVKDSIAEYRNCYYKGSEKSWPAYSSALKRFLKYCSIDMGKLKKAIQYLEAGKNKERDVAMFLMELSFGLERRKLRFLKWKENFDWNNDGSIKDKLKLEKRDTYAKGTHKSFAKLENSIL